MALEALRDREIWKKKGAERLREAGFGVEEVRRWEEGGLGIGSSGGGRGVNGNGIERERDVEAVRWRAKGEEREWDVGKVVLEGDEEDDGDGNGKKGGGKEGRKLKGEVVLEAAWKRKGAGFVREMKRALG